MHVKEAVHLPIVPIVHRLEGFGVSNKICPNCYQDWPDCVCVIPLRPPEQSNESGAVVVTPRPHPVLSRQLLIPGGLKRRVLGVWVSDPPKEFCDGCSAPWPSCRCAGKRL